MRESEFLEALRKAAREAQEILAAGREAMRTHVQNMDDARPHVGWADLQLELRHYARELIAIADRPSPSGPPRG